MARAAQHWKQELKKSPRAVQYLKGRGLTGEIAARFALGYAPDNWRGLASVFPRYDDPLLVEQLIQVKRAQLLHQYLPWCLLYTFHRRHLHRDRLLVQFDRRDLA